ncbi:MAG: hypothetical protein QM214_04920 [Bacillota bacterium]|nr:hypothetical protein [Bacillota bacterium]HHU43696.1 hypothetical protein [Clostridiales bacterium]
MESFIRQIENYFKESWKKVFERAENYRLTPAQIIEIVHYYQIYKNKKSDRDDIMYKMSDISMHDMIQYLMKIKREALELLS